jgi:hypothetical protein
VEQLETELNTRDTLVRELKEGVTLRNQQLAEGQQKRNALEAQV